MALNLLDNTFVCDCEFLHFLLWIVSKLQTTRTTSYTCLLDGITANIDDISLNAAKIQLLQKLDYYNINNYLSFIHFCFKFYCIPAVWQTEKVRETKYNTAYFSKTFKAN